MGHKTSDVIVENDHHQPINLQETEVFGDPSEGVKFRTVGWIRASMFCIKMTFGTGVLSIPATLYTLGAVAGPLFIVFWGLLNTYMAIILTDFKLRHPSVHTVTDAAYVATLNFGYSKRAAIVSREITDVLYFFTWILSGGISILSLSIGLNAVSNHATCSIVWGFVSYFIVSTVASIRTIQRLSWVAWVGFVSIVSAIMVVVIAVTIPTRPAYAPQTGDFDLGFSAFPAAGTTFASAWAASLAIFSSSANTSGFLTVVSEMPRPKDFFKSLYACMGWVTASYLAFSLVVFAYAGKWVTSPALGSAGPTIKIISYSIAIPGMIAGAMICVHVAAKSLFVRILRGTDHLTHNTKTHWSVWLACTFGTGLVGWILSEAIPFFSSLVSLVGALGFGPVGICLPAILWFSINGRTAPTRPMHMIGCIFHGSIFVLGLLVTVGGTYANVIEIIRQFQAGSVGSPFECADNSGTVVAN